MFSPLVEPPRLMYPVEVMVPPQVVPVETYIPMAPPFINYPNRSWQPRRLSNAQIAALKHHEAERLRRAALPLSILSFFCGGLPCAIPAIALACQNYGSRRSYTASIILAIAAMLTGFVIIIGLSVWGVGSHFGLTPIGGFLPSRNYDYN